MPDPTAKPSKLMSYILRHRPDEFGIVLDASGWVTIKELASKSGGELNEKMIRNVIATSEKKRFALSDDGLSVRANQGHSIKVDLALPPKEPPQTLFHGTADRFIESIKTNGLLPGSQQHVHLSPDREAARTVGARHGKPVILTIDARTMHSDGITFFLAQNGVWLTGHVASRYIAFP
ncbi:MAG: RNA 2'-phosphotransferase [Pseudomonadota bacterium]